MLKNKSDEIVFFNARIEGKNHRDWKICPILYKDKVCSSSKPGYKVGTYRVGRNCPVLYQLGPLLPFSGMSPMRW